MMRKPFLLTVLLILVISTMACGLNINLPFTTDIKTGPTVVEEIIIPIRDPSEVTDITFAFGAGKFSLSPGAQSALVEGSATFNVNDFKPTIDTSDNVVEVMQGNLEINGIPNFDEKVINEWDIKLSNKPINLTIKAGAYVGDFDLGGSSLKNVHITDGASDVNLTFTDENQVKMNTFRYETGASNVTMKNLGFANFGTMLLDSGAGNYDIDFSGGIEEDINVFIETGLSNVTIRVPENTKAVLKLEGALTGVDVFGEWERSDDTFTINNNGPTIYFTVKMGAGNLTLRTD